jgi:subfamily B ATP-binding cassette protein MsbA
MKDNNGPASPERAKPSSYAQFKKTWSYVIPYFYRYKKLMYLVFFLTILASVADPGLAVLADPFINYYVVNPEKGRHILWLIPFGIIALFGYRSIMQFSSKYLLEYLCIQVVRDLQVALYDHYMHLSLDHYERTTTGKMVSRTANDVTYMQRIVPLTIDVLQDFFQLLLLVGVCFYKQPYFSALAILAIPLTVYPVQRVSSAMKRYTKRGLKQISELNSIMVEVYSGAKVVKAFAMENKEVERYRQEMRKYMRLLYKYAAAKNAISPIIGFITAFAIAPIFYIGVVQIVPNLDAEILKEKLGSFVSFMVALVLMYNPVRKLGTSAGHFNSAYGAAERIRETLEQQSTVIEDPHAIELPPLKKSIKYDHVNFSYEHDRVLHDFCLEIKAGELVALVGESGAGKTTVVNLLPRFYDIQSGSITIDGVDIRKATLKSLRLQIGVVTQETFLFADTVHNNICYGAENRSRQEVMAVAKAAYAHDFIMELPQGYDTIVGERGVKLSGGQRQRLAIARALLRDPPILLLDEATSALDTSAEREVQKALDSLMKNRTTIAIAHRLSTIRLADKIVVMKDGRILEQGSHYELMGREGEYKRLYEMQFFLGKFAADHYEAGPRKNKASPA